MADKDLTGELSLELLPKVQHLIDAARRHAAIAVNAELTMLYWQVGKLLKEHVLEGARAEYGKQVINRLSAELTSKNGKGWRAEQLRHCIRAAESFPDEQIVYTLCTKLSWSHIRKLIFIDDPLKREFYAEMAQNWRSCHRPPSVGPNVQIC